MATKKKTAAAQPAEPPQPIQSYGCKIDGKDQWFYDRFAFCWRTPIDFGAPRRIDLFKRLAAKINPTYFEWHPWTEKLVESACENQWLAISGAAGSAKTYNITGFACTWWLSNPGNSSVIYCSTTAKALRKRGWQNVQRFYTTVPGPRLGNFVDSRMIWQCTKGDDRNAIMGIAVEEGETNKVADNIKGVHTLRQMVIIDEATAVPTAIFEACTNLYSYPKEFILVMLGNPRSRLDEFGKFMEPKDGWQSVSIETEEWETTPKINGKTGICIRFDAEKSPNITLGSIVSKHLPTKERVEARKRAAGWENDPSYWSNERGFPPPEGLNKNVFSESMLQTHDAYGKHRFTGSDFTIIGALDPARTGGDRAALRFAKLGEIENGEWGMEVGPPIVVRLNAQSSNPIDYQLTEQVQRECGLVKCFGNATEYWCRPEHFGVDATGGGADLCDIMQRIWSPKIIRIGFGESPSDDACSHEDIRPASEVYRNRRAEMYFRTANAVKSNQLKGIDRETARELVTIEFDDSKPKIVLMSKEDYRKKFGKSPDFADCLIELLEVARRLGFRLAAVGLSAGKAEEFTALAEKTKDIFSAGTYEEEEESEPDDDDEGVPTFADMV